MDPLLPQKNTPKTDPPQKENKIETLLSIMSRLRDKQNGCPWDIEQDFKSIAPCTIEEAYEVVDAIDRGHMKDLKEELGDLLLQVVFHSQMAQELHIFDFNDVVQGLIEKLVSRHPHIFDKANAKSAKEVIDIWQSVKDTEEKSIRPKTSILDDIPIGFPSLLRAQKLSKKAAKVGFEWPDTSQVIDKIIEELEEFRAELGPDNRQRQEEELGDVLFTVVQLARHLDLDCEETLRHGNHKFYRRFSGIEADSSALGKDLSSLTPAEWDGLWELQKEKEKQHLKSNPAS